LARFRRGTVAAMLADQHQQLSRGFPLRRSTAMIVGIDRFAQPLQSELDIVRLQMAPALDLGLVSIFREALEMFRRELLRGLA
jgi:hypothetical protein